MDPFAHHNHLRQERHAMVRRVKRQLFPNGGDGGGGADSTGVLGPAQATSPAANSPSPAPAAHSSTAAAQSASPIVSVGQPQTSPAAAPSTQAVAPSSTRAAADPDTSSASSAAAVTASTSSTSSLATTSSSSSSSRPTRTTDSATLSSSSATITSAGSTSVVVVSAVPSNQFASGTIPTLSAASSSPSAGGDSDGSVGTGTVIGAVAGGLVGLVVLASLVGIFFKSRWGKSDDEYEDNPFGNEKFSGIELHDGGSDAGHSTTHLAHVPPMSALSRSGTVISAASGLSGAGSAHHPWNVHDGPVPPMPSFEPGQVVLYGPDGLPRSVSPQPPQQMGGGGAAPMNYSNVGPNGYMMPPPQIAALERAASARYAQGGGASPAPSLAAVPPHVYGYPPPPQEAPPQLPTPQGFRPLSLVHEESEPAGSVRDSANDSAAGRSGTPTNPNPQQRYYHDSFGSHNNHHGGSAGTAADFNAVQHASAGSVGSAGEGVTRDLTGGAGGVGRDTRAKRTLSVRNGGLDDVDEDPYGGM